MVRTLQNVVLCAESVKPDRLDIPLSVKNGGLKTVVSRRAAIEFGISMPTLRHVVKHALMGTLDSVLLEIMRVSFIPMII